MKLVDLIAFLEFELDEEEDSIKSITIDGKLIKVIYLNKMGDEYELVKRIKN